MELGIQGKILGEDHTHKGEDIQMSASRLIISEYNCRRDVRVDSACVSSVIKACSCLLQAPHLGKQLHSHVVKLGFESDIIVLSALLKMYGMFGDIADARKVFDGAPRRDIVLSNALIASYSRNNKPREAILSARAMVKEQMRPSEVTMTTVLSACSALKDSTHGKEVHGYSLRNLVVLDTHLHNSLISMYAKCGYLTNARNLFESMANRSMVSWTCMIHAYCENDSLNEALALFKEMQTANIRLDEATLLAVISLCLKLESSELVHWIEEFAERDSLHNSTRVANALVIMHSKRGNLRKSCKIFDRMTKRTLVSWTAMIQGLALHGHGMAALIRFSQMLREGFTPDEIVFLNIINACSHAGLVMEGKHCFRSMVEEHDITPWMDHYGSMVDLLCRAGLLDEAFGFIVSMPVEPDVVIWRMLIGRCRDQANMGLAMKVLDYVIELDPEHKGNYTLKSNVYAMFGDWSGVLEVRDIVKFKGIAKAHSSCSLVEIS